MRELWVPKDISRDAQVEHALRLLSAETDVEVMVHAHGHDVFCDGDLEGCKVYTHLNT